MDFPAPCPSATPDISVCVVTYKHESVLRECLQSLVDQQTTRSFEVIVGEDCSPDGTRRIVEEFADKYPHIIRPLLHETNKGMIGNYLTVHRAARGKYVCHCDGDDYWEPGKLQAQADFLDTERDCVAVFSNSYVIDERGQRVGVFNSRVRRKFDLAYLIQDGNFLHHSTMMYRREIQSHMFPRQPEFIDFHIYVLVARHGLLGYVDQYLASYRDQSASSVIRHDNERIRRLNWQALAEVKPTDVPHAVIRRADAKFLAGAFYHALRSRRLGMVSKWIALARREQKLRWLPPLHAMGMTIQSVARKSSLSLLTRLKAISRTERVYYPKQP